MRKWLIVILGSFMFQVICGQIELSVILYFACQDTIFIWKKYEKAQKIQAHNQRMLSY
jgi:hypothetical protein